MRNNALQAGEIRNTGFSAYRCSHCTSLRSSFHILSARPLRRSSRTAVNIMSSSRCISAASISSWSVTSAETSISAAMHSAFLAVCESVILRYGLHAGCAYLRRFQCRHAQTHRTGTLSGHFGSIVFQSVSSAAFWGPFSSDPISCLFRGKIYCPHFVSLWMSFGQNFVFFFKFGHISL